MSSVGTMWACLGLFFGYRTCECVNKVDLAQNPRVSVNFLHFITVAPFIQVHIILNASISISSFCLFFGWTCGVEIAVVTHGMKISTVVAMNADWEIFFFSTWPKRQDYRFTQPRTCKLLSQERKETWTRWRTTFPRLFVAATVWQVPGGKRCVSAGRNWNGGKWMAEMNKYIHLYPHVCKGGTLWKCFYPSTILGCSYLTLLFLLCETFNVCLSIIIGLSVLISLY